MSSLAALPASTNALSVLSGFLSARPKRIARELAGVLDHARGRDGGGDIGGAANDAFRAQHAGKPLDTVDAVLKCNEAAVRPEQRARGCCRRFGIPQLDREQHDVDWPDLGRIIGDVRLRQMQIAVHALDHEAVFLDRVAMSAACDEEDIVARRRHARAEISADRTRCHCCNTHCLLPP